MEIQAFTFFQESLPHLRAPHALASVRPWVDVGSVGSLVLADLEASFKASGSPTGPISFNWLAIGIGA